MSSVSTNESRDFFWAICKKRTTSSKFPENKMRRKWITGNKAIKMTFRLAKDVNGKFATINVSEI